jgi:hypothetical protein
MDPNNQNNQIPADPNLSPTGLPRDAHEIGRAGVPNNPNYQAPNTPISPQTVMGGAQTNQAPTTAPIKGNPNSTQNTLLISEIRDGVVIMNDGSFRSVLMLQSINFELMNPEEREAVEFAYQGFLNSLAFPIQIFVRSQKIDIGPYIQKLDKVRTEHDNMLLSMLMEDYINFMIGLSEQTNIMDKKFYLVIPYFPVVGTQKAVEASKGIFTGIFGRKEQLVVINETELSTAKTELRNRIQSVLAALLQCGIQGLPLDTQELIELYYDAYNPDTATRQQLRYFDDLTAPVVTKGDGYIEGGMQ